MMDAVGEGTAIQLHHRAERVHGHGRLRHSRVLRRLALTQAGDAGDVVHRLGADHVLVGGLPYRDHVIRAPGRAADNGGHIPVTDQRAIGHAKERDADAVFRDAAAGGPIRQGRVGHLAADPGQPGALDAGVAENADARRAEVERRRRVVHVDLPGRRRPGAVAGQVGDARRQLVGSGAVGRKGGAPGLAPRRGSVQAPWHIAPGEARLARRFDAQLGLRDAGGGIAGERQQLPGQVRPIGRRGIERRGWGVGVHRDILALTIFHPTSLGQEGSVNLGRRQGAVIDGDLVDAPGEFVVSPPGIGIPLDFVRAVPDFYRRVVDVRGPIGDAIRDRASLVAIRVHPEMVSIVDPHHIIPGIHHQRRIALRLHRLPTIVISPLCKFDHRFEIASQVQMIIRN